MVPRFYEFTALRNGKTERKGVCEADIWILVRVNLRKTNFLTYVHMLFTASGLKCTFAMVNEVDI